MWDEKSAEQFSAQPVGERRRGKHIPEESHGEILQNCPNPYGRQLAYRHACHYDVKKDCCDQAHGRAHDGNSSRLTQNTAQVGIILFRIAVLCGKMSAETISPEIGEKNDKQPHVDHFQQRMNKYIVCHAAGTSLCQMKSLVNGSIVDLHVLRHGVRHNDPENNPLCFGFRHWYYLLQINQI